MRILMIDDDPATRFLLEKHLSHLGECVQAENGEKGLSLFASGLTCQNPFHLVFVDIMMQRLDGHKTLQGIREMEQKLAGPNAEPAKIIMITALHDTDNIYHSYERGCDAYLTKPFLAEDLITVLDKLNGSGP